MKKTIQKPENWQDFESLCKKLWGEIWSIPMKIKKNGRNGQPQAGVDIYGVPKGEENYWGIQCKGKDEYINAKLSKKEIDEEIAKAINFTPPLEVFIFATSMNKDSHIEEYIRNKDLESRKNGGFEILLYCWEDIVDLLEENPDTLNSYLTGNNIKNKYDLNVTFSNYKSEIEIKPKFLKKTTKHRIKQVSESDILRGTMPIMEQFKNKPISLFGDGTINKSWCKIELIINNCGNVAIENWKVRFWFDDNISKIDDDYSSNSLISTQVMLEIQRNRTTFAHPDDKLIVYVPNNEAPLIQKDNAYVTAYVIPKFDSDNIKIRWELLARDYNKEGSLTINVIPEYKEETDWIDIRKNRTMPNDKVEIKELIE